MNKYIILLLISLAILAVLTLISIIVVQVIRRHFIFEKGDVVGLKSVTLGDNYYTVEGRNKFAGHKYIVVRDGNGYLWNYSKDQLFIRVKYYHKDFDVKPHKGSKYADF